MSKVSFDADIRPLFHQFRDSMMWRLDLCNYEHVKANASMVYSQIQTSQMPPQPYPPLTTEQVRLFSDWMKQDFPK